jgi:hypothetical protein
MTDNGRKTGAAVEAHFQFLMWLAPVRATTDSALRLRRFDEWFAHLQYNRTRLNILNSINGKNRYFSNSELRDL